MIANSNRIIKSTLEQAKNLIQRGRWFYTQDFPKQTLMSVNTVNSN